MMKAIRMQRQGGAEQMVYEDAPRPEPAVGEVLVQVCAAAVTPTELAWELTWMNYAGEARTLPIPGHEFSGVIFKAGEGVRDVAVGDEVYGLNDWTVDGALAEYVIATAAQIAPKPASVSHELAAAVPLSALTAWQALIIRANIITSSPRDYLLHNKALASSANSFQHLINVCVWNTMVSRMRKKSAKVVAFLRERGRSFVV